MKKRVLFVILLCTLVFSVNSSFVFAAADSSSSSSESSSGGGGGISLIPDWVYDIMDKLDAMIDNFNKLMSGELVGDMINKLVVGWADQIAAPMFGVFAKLFLFTPEIANIQFIYKIWSFTMWSCLALLSVSVLILSYKVFFAKQSMGRLLILFAACTIGVYYSLTGLHAINVFVNYITQKSIEGILGQTGIGYQGIPGADILKALVIGKDVFTNPEYANMTLGQIVSGTDGGIFTLIGFLYGVETPYFYISILKCIVLFIITGGINLWIVYIVFTGKIETFAGIIDLYVRTLLVGYICGITWAGFVRVQADYNASGGLSADIFGIGPVYLASGVVFCECIFFIFFWLKPIFLAAKDFKHLNGGKVIEKFGNNMSGFSKVANVAAKRLGMEGLQRKSLDMASTFDKISAVGTRIKTMNSSSRLMKAAGMMTGGVSEVLQGVKYQSPKLDLVTKGSIITNQKPNLQVTGSRITPGQVPMSSTILTNQGYTPTQRVQIKPESLAGAEKWFDTIAPEMKEGITFHKDTGELYMPNAAGNDKIMESIGEAKLEVQPTIQGLMKNDVFVQSDNGQVYSQQSESSQNEKKNLEKIFPMIEKVELSKHDTKQTATKLESMTDKHKWANQVTADEQGTGLWIPQDHIAEAIPLIADMSVKRQAKPRIEAPTNSKFLGDMLEHVSKSTQQQPLFSTIEYKDGDSHLYIAEEHTAAFKKLYDGYVKGREPYWTDKHGEVWVIQDQQPVQWGFPPEQGLNMGSFENLNKQAHMDHALDHQKQKKTKTTKSGASGKSSASAKSVAPASSSSSKDPSITPPGSDKEKS